MPESVRRLTSLDRAIRILDCFSRERPVLSVGEVAQAAGLEKSSVSRFMTNLAEARFLTRVGPGRYSLGLRLFELGSIVHSALRIEDVARPLIQDLATRGGCAAQVTAADPDGLVVVATADSPVVPRFSVPLGTRVPLHASAAGKVICAFREDIRARLPDGEALAKLADNTITDRRELDREIVRTREQGWGLAEGEYFPGQFSISAPVWDHTGRVTAAVTAIAGRPTEMEGVSALRHLVQDTAARLSTGLGGRELVG